MDSTLEKNAEFIWLTYCQNNKNHKITGAIVQKTLNISLLAAEMNHTLLDQ